MEVRGCKRFKASHLPLKLVGLNELGSLLNYELETNLMNSLVYNN
jgi:hypothetical protein